MKRHWNRSGIIAATMLTWLAVSTHTASASNFPKLARSYTAWMARAFDQCAPATVSVTTAMVPTGGCLAGHVVTSSNNMCDFAKLTVGSTPAKIRLFAKGCKCGSRIGRRWSRK